MCVLPWARTSRSAITSWRARAVDTSIGFAVREPRSHPQPDVLRDVVAAVQQLGTVARLRGHHGGPLGFRRRIGRLVEDHRECLGRCFPKIERALPGPDRGVACSGIAVCLRRRSAGACRARTASRPRRVYPRSPGSRRGRARRRREPWTQCVEAILILHGFTSTRPSRRPRPSALVKVVDCSCARHRRMAGVHDLRRLVVASVASHARDHCVPCPPRLACRRRPRDLDGVTAWR